MSSLIEDTGASIPTFDGVFLWGQKKVATEVAAFPVTYHHLMR